MVKEDCGWNTDIELTWSLMLLILLTARFEDILFDLKNCLQ